MSDRFEWLEFHESTPASADKTPQRDIRGMMMEAQRAYDEGEYEAALKLFSEVLKCDKALLDAWAGQVRCLARLGELREAQTWAARACTLFPATPQLESARAYALASAGLQESALVASDAALEIAERTGLSNPRIWLDRGVCLLAEGQRSTASFCFGKVREITPNEPQWEQEMGIELLLAGDAAGALTAFNLVVERHPHRAYAWILLARAARQLGLRARACEALERAEAVRPGHAEAARERAQLQQSWLSRVLSEFGRKFGGS